MDGIVSRGALLEQLAAPARPSRGTILRRSLHWAAIAFLFLAAKFPHRQFNSAELCVLSGVGRTAMSQIKNAKDTPFSLGKCTLQRLDAWLAKRERHAPGCTLCQS
jgi:hypothetical protein